MLYINQQFKDAFQETPILAFRKNRNLEWKTRFSTVSQNQQTYAVSKFCTHYLLKAKSNENYILHDLNYKSELLMYPMECMICHIQYIGKSETEFNIRLNNHRKDF